MAPRREAGRPGCYGEVVPRPPWHYIPSFCGNLIPTKLCDNLVPRQAEIFMLLATILVGLGTLAMLLA